MRVRRWLVFLLGGAVLVAVGITLLGGLGQALVVFLGIAVIAFTLIRALGDYDPRRDPPVPPGAPGGAY
jgi:hypothetical protein